MHQRLSAVSVLTAPVRCAGFSSRTDMEQNIPLGATFDAPRAANQAVPEDFVMA
jgi:hypothetical protein